MIERNGNKGLKPQTNHGSCTVQLKELELTTQHHSYLESLFFEELNLPLIKISKDNEVVKWNEETVALLDISDKAFSYLTMEELNIRWPIMKRVMAVVDMSRERGEPVEEEFECEDLTVKIRALSPTGEETTYVMFFDLSIQKQFESLLTFHHQMEAVSHIAAGVAHELRNPLSVIKGFLQLSQLTDGFSKYYDTIMSELNRMNGIIEDFLSVSRKKIERKSQSPKKIMDSLTEIIKSECLLHNVSFEIDLQPTSKMVYVNESMIKQVILNLLRNSIEAFGDAKIDRLFRVQAIPKEHEYVLTVEDNGKGMTKEVLAQLGKPFFTTKDRGTGIGIPLCKKIIEDHNGTFQIESERYKGTKVTIRLPFSS
ncbi:two-component system sensor histidine kinase NtrB [Halalkalibacterium halodurans]|uniref:two-component system sensor histidine kinase NtrB n=1 Tax=Halalkalibacterium halodurans TaxID=86665 RepID=UPI002AAA3D20|nr:HAMP domain-containing sensor histidine kinase [Halalkalibacterium halodurans]MDY7221912.1 HAMP domain-containing sensor histidine kinase [Halalkalibacterium halodurans]MDY7241188.1 HAMP domain-containing sensor histidine kinase [Halalkalibacterium halodurans]